MQTVAFMLTPSRTTRRPRGEATPENDYFFVTSQTSRPSCFKNVLTELNDTCPRRVVMRPEVARDEVHGGLTQLNGSAG